MVVLCLLKTSYITCSDREREASVRGWLRCWASDRHHPMTAQAKTPAQHQARCRLRSSMPTALRPPSPQCRYQDPEDPMWQVSTRTAKMNPSSSPAARCHCHKQALAPARPIAMEAHAPTDDDDGDCSSGSAPHLGGGCCCRMKLKMKW